MHRGLQELTGQVTRCAARLTRELGRAPSVQELAVRVGRPQERVLEALDCAGRLMGATGSVAMAGSGPVAAGG